MSEYQYYEFQAIDRPLTLDEQKAVASLSSRVSPHPRRAAFTYSFGGGLRRRPEDLLADYYDAMLYLANWGSRQLMFRFPKSLIDLEQVEPYCIEDRVTFSDVGDYVVLDIELSEEEGGDWIEGEGILDRLIGLREEILSQDYRVLYLAWLKAVELEGEFAGDADLEPPVPPGLHKLSPALQAFVVLFEVDEHLIQMAAKSSDQPAKVEVDVRRAIAQLPREECEVFLLRLAQGEPHLSVELNRKLQTLIGRPERKNHPRRTVGQLLAAAEREREQVAKRRAEEAEAKRIRELEELQMLSSAALPFDVLAQVRELAGHGLGLERIKGLCRSAGIMVRSSASKYQLVHVIIRGLDR
ncbi:MAG: hypothetical protein JW850_11130 [Thermoflexales bacterium]|nr:hypothetical protein [Thermoflexales bacterium]